MVGELGTNRTNGEGLESRVSDFSFDPQKIRHRIKEVKPGEEKTVLDDDVCYCDVDLFNSSKLVHILNEEYGYTGTFFTKFIRDGVRKIVNNYGGLFLQTMGDSAEFLFGDNDLEKAIRCTQEVMFWGDRELTEYIKDHVAAREILKQERSLSGDIPIDDELVQKKLLEVRKVKDLWDDQVPEESRALKDAYELEYAKVDRKIESGISDAKWEDRGRIPMKAGIAIDNMKIWVSKITDEEGDPETQRFVEGDVKYLIARLTAKDGPLGGQRDVIKVASYKVIRLPPFIKHSEGETRTVANSTFFVYDTFGVDNAKHPTFDGRIPDKSPLAKKLQQHRGEVGKELEFIRILQDKDRDASRPWLDVTIEKREGGDRYKNGRSLMVAKTVLGIVDEVIQIYERYTSRIKRKTGENPKTLDEFAYLRDLSKAYALSQSVKAIGASRRQMVVAALLYSNGGSLLRVNTPTPKYPTRRLTPDNNRLRIEGEREEIYKAASKYPELVDIGIPEIMQVQDLPLSRIREKYGYELALKTMILRIATRYVHHTSYRSWKPRINSEEALRAIRNELADIVRPDGTGYDDRNFEIVDHALRRILKIGNITYTKKSA